MLKPALTVLVLSFAVLPNLAAAQAMGSELDSPVLPPVGSTSASARNTPEPAEHASDPDAIPEAPRALTRPYVQTATVDPEILELRANQPAIEAGIRLDARRVARLQAYEARLAATQAAPRHLSFGASTGLAWAGFGVGSGAGALLGVVGGAIACEAANRFSCNGDLGLGALFGAAAISPLGSAVGVWLHGDAQGAGGNFFAALAGSYLGAGAGAAIMAGMLSTGELGTMLLSPIGAAVGMVLSTLGAAAGYHLTAGGSEESATEHAQTIILPTLAPTEDGAGATIGAAGMF